jgi:anhydro-N-acetylmuramic acid kinase
MVKNRRRSPFPNGSSAPPCSAGSGTGSGGGTHNPALTAMPARCLPGVALRTSDELGLPSDAKEAYAFAVPGFLTVHGLPGSVPASIGARHARVLGSVTPGRDGLRLPSPARQKPVRLVLD